MIKTVVWRDWVFESDNGITQATYEQVECGGADSCICNDCKNFAAGREKAFPAEIRHLFESLGIDITKESEVCHYTKLENGLHHYGGWFHFKGRIKQGNNCTIQQPSGGYTFDLTPVSSTFRIGFRTDSALTFFKDKEDLVQVEFETHIPRRIDKELETE
jgi:hypothetical protein